MRTLFPFIRPYSFQYPAGESRQASRDLEWYLVFLDVIYGVLLLMPSWPVLRGSLYEHLLGIMPELAWGVVFVAKGILHGTSLWWNGRSWWTPWLRATSCGLSSLFWWWLLVLMLLNPTFRPDFLLAFSILTSITYALSARACGADARRYWERHRGNHS